MMGAGPLSGVRVLVTRAAHQADQLMALIREAGGQPLLLPALEIAPPSNPEAIKALGRALETYDMAIFVSPNAVRGALKYLGRRLPPRLALVAVGPGTARALVDAGHESVLVPDNEFNSEAILQLPQLRNVRGKRVVIFRGDTGRGLLREALEARDAKVEYAEVYRREMPTSPTSDVRAALIQRRVDAVLVTSALALEQLVKLCEDDMRPGLMRAQLVVSSERMIKLAESLGFRAPLVASEPGDQALLDALVSWRTHQPPQETG